MLFSQDELAELPLSSAGAIQRFRTFYGVTPCYQRKIKEEVEALGDHLASPG